MGFHQSPGIETDYRKFCPFHDHWIWNKAEEAGIVLVMQEENHTSRCNFLDREHPDTIISILAGE